METRLHNISYFYHYVQFRSLILYSEYEKFIWEKKSNWDYFHLLDREYHTTSLSLFHLDFFSVFSFHNFIIIYFHFISSLDTFVLSTLFPFAVHQICSFYLYIPSVHTIGTFHLYIPSVHTIHTYHT